VTNPPAGPATAVPWERQVSATLSKEEPVFTHKHIRSSALVILTTVAIVAGASGPAQAKPAPCWIDPNNCHSTVTHAGF
jgi:hypothetical protein